MWSIAPRTPNSASTLSSSWAFWRSDGSSTEASRTGGLFRMPSSGRRNAPGSSNGSAGCSSRSSRLESLTGIFGGLIAKDDAVGEAASSSANGSGSSSITGATRRSALGAFSRLTALGAAAATAVLRRHGGATKSRASRLTAANAAPAIQRGCGALNTLSGSSARLSKVSPAAPPNPLANGQAFGGAGAAKAPASAVKPSTAARTRRRTPRRTVAAPATRPCRPAANSAIAMAQDARPSDWLARSATVAPGAPSQLAGRPAPAASKLGSLA